MISGLNFQSLIFSWQICVVPGSEKYKSNMFAKICKIKIIYFLIRKNTSTAYKLNIPVSFFTAGLFIRVIFYESVIKV